MIAGTIILEDSIIHFRLIQNDEQNSALWTICDPATGKEETHVSPSVDFMNALAIAVHVEGDPNAERDYPSAESIQGEIRWIP